MLECEPDTRNVTDTEPAGMALIARRKAVVNMESTPKNTQESLQTHLDNATLALALPVGRRLFENGHFAFAALSAPAHLPLHEAKMTVSPLDVRTALPERLLAEASLLTGLGVVAEALRGLWARTEAFFVHLATSELNHVDALPVPTARLAGDVLAYLATPHAPDANLATASEAWKSRLTTTLGRATACPADFAGFLSLEEEATLRSVAFGILVQAETLDRALRGFAKIRITSLTPTPSGSAGSPASLETRTRARKALFTAVLGGETTLASSGHTSLLEGRPVDACLAVEASLLQSQHLLDLLRHDVEASRTKGAGSGHRDMALENAAYGAALERQLRLQGVDAMEATTLVREVVAYAAHHASPCAEILDDEMLRMAPRISREALVRARLHVRHDDRDYPLSVAARNALLVFANTGRTQV
jgi:hypothetical protein